MSSFTFWQDSFQLGVDQDNQWWSWDRDKVRIRYICCKCGKVEWFYIETQCFATTLYTNIPHHTKTEYNQHTKIKEEIFKPNEHVLLQRE